MIVTDHPVVTTGNATKDIMNMPLWISQWLKDSFLNKQEEENKISIKKIYIDRNDDISNKMPQRLISNEDEVRKFLFKNNFTPVKLHDIKFIDQVKLFNNAECIVGLHGGGFANLAFCKPETKVIELNSMDAGTPIENLAKKNDLNYNCISVKAKQIKKYNFPNQQGSIEIPINDLIRLVEN